MDFVQTARYVPPFQRQTIINNVVQILCAMSPVVLMLMLQPYVRTDATGSKQYVFSDWHMPGIVHVVPLQTLQYVWQGVPDLYADVVQHKEEIVIWDISQRLVTS